MRGYQFAAFFIALVTAQFVTADEPAWNRFRGPNGSGVSDAKGLPTTWTAADYRWTVSLPGEGVSSPVVWGDKLFVTAADDEKLTRSLLCYSTSDGKLLWSRQESFTAEKKHRQNSYATNTPAVDGDRVYAFWQSREGSQLKAYDHGGNQVWSFDVGPYTSNHGGGISPAVIAGVVALNLNHEGASRMLGVDAATGKQRWSIPRDVIRASYSTPCAYVDPSGRELAIFTCWKHGFTAVDPQAGKIVWEKDDAFDRVDQEDKRSIGSPFTAGGVIYGNCGFVGGKKFLTAVRSSASNSAEVEQLFRIDRNVNHMPTALVYNGLLFLWNDAGIVACAKADTGETIWTERIGGKFSSSPICVDGKIYGTSDEGEVIVIAAAKEFLEIGRTQLGEGTSATPAVAGGTIYFRTRGKLFALGAKGK